jgi:acyl-CoA thioester hydrolase
MIFRHTVRIYWEDTDASGLVYHTSYIRFMERGRTELLRTLDLAQSAMLAGETHAPFFFVVRAMDVDFRRPALLDDLLTIETEVTQLGGASITLAQRAMRGSELLVAAKVTVACVADGKARRMPDDVRRRFESAIRPAG